MERHSCYLPFPIPQLTPVILLTNTLLPVPQLGTRQELGAREGKRGLQRSTGCRGWSTAPAALTVALCLQAVAEKGYETGEHAPGLKLGGCAAYKAAHHIIKVKTLLKL